MAPLTVAAVQTTSVPADIDTNAARGADLVQDAAAHGARVVVFPELFLCGFDLTTIESRAEECLLEADALSDPRLDRLVASCAEAGAVAFVGAAVRHADGRSTIAVLAVTDHVALAYEKQHLCADEATLFLPGHDGAVVVVDEWPIGLAVCYDGCFPEHARAAADGGALVYAAPMAYAIGSEHRRDLYYRARAVENGIAVVTSGLVGRCGDADFSGGSGVFDAEGRPLASVADGASGIAVATLDAESTERTRATHRMHADHRASLGTLRRLAV